MQIRLATALIASILAGCASQSPDTPVQRSAEKNGRTNTETNAQSNAHTLDGYKRDLAMRISQMNSNKVYSGRPQALLRSVVVLRYAVDEHGQLLRSEIMRSNRDRETEKIALATLQNSAPFPKPASHLVRNGRLDISETWLFNNDGRFQLRTIAEPQMDR